MRFGNGSKTPKGEKMHKNDHCLCGVGVPEAVEWRQHCVTVTDVQKCHAHGHQGKARIDLEYI